MTSSGTINTFQWNLTALKWDNEAEGEVLIATQQCRHLFEKESLYPWQAIHSVDGVLASFQSPTINRAGDPCYVGIIVLDMKPNDSISFQRHVVKENRIYGNQSLLSMTRLPMTLAQRQMMDKSIHEADDDDNDGGETDETAMQQEEEQKPVDVVPTHVRGRASAPAPVQAPPAASAPAAPYQGNPHTRPQQSAQPQTRQPPQNRSSVPSSQGKQGQAPPPVQQQQQPKPIQQQQPKPIQQQQQPRVTTTTRPSTQQPPSKRPSPSDMDLKGMPIPVARTQPRPQPQPQPQPQPKPQSNVNTDWNEDTEADENRYADDEEEVVVEPI